MKRLVFTIFFLLLSSNLYAQTTIHVLWDPNPPVDNVSNYMLYVDGLAPVSVAPTTDPSCSCIKAAVVVNNGAHTIKVSAVNLLISSDPTSTVEGPQASVNFTINPGGQVKNVKVTK